MKEIIKQTAVNYLTFTNITKTVAELIVEQKA